MKLVSLGVATALALSPGGSGPEPLKPSTGWNIDYAETSCTLSRSFGTGEDAVALGIIPQTGGGRVRIALISKNPDRFTGSGRALMRFEDRGAYASTRYYSLLDPKSGRIGLIRTMRDQLAPLGQAKVLMLDLGGHRISFAIPQMASALRALAACEDDLARSWGFDPAQIAARPVAISPQSWISSGDYPGAAERAKLAGESGVRVSVDVAGNPSACAITEQSGVPELDKKACEIIMRSAKFKPATAKDGKPIAGMWTTSFMWMLPGSRLY